MDSDDSITCKNIKPDPASNRCVYKTYDDICDDMKKANSTTIFIIHFNIVSLTKNFDKVMTFLNQLPKLPEIICLSKTRLTESKLSSVNIQGFILCNQNSMTKARGSAIYVSKTLESHELLELNLNVKDCEDVWVGIICSGKELLIIGSVYRHPNNNLTNFECALISKIRSIKSKQQCIVTSTLIMLISTRFLL